MQSEHVAAGTCLGGARELCDASYQPRDFLLLPYVPPASPLGKLAPGNLLLESLACAPGNGFAERMTALLADLRALLGVNELIWGFKVRPEGPFWELYFYRGERPALVEVGRVFQTVSRHLPNPFAEAPGVDPAHGYGLFSFEVAPDSRRVEEYDLYTMEPPFAPRDPLADPSAFDSEDDPPYLRHVLRSGAVLRAHSFRMVSGKRPRHASYYAAYLPHQREALLTAMRRSPFAAYVTTGEEVHLDRFGVGKFVAHALKQDAAGLYFAHVGLATAVDFLKHFAFPREFVSFLESHSPELDHLLFDLGCDYTAESGRTVFTKAAIFGTY